METTINFGKHKNKPLDEVPMDYLIWLFPKMQFKRSQQKLFKAILEYFLTRGIRIEDHRNKSQGFHFYFTDYVNPKVDGGERPFMQSFWRMKNSKGEFVYEVGSQKYPIYILSGDAGYTISDKYISNTYNFGGLTLVYEKNPDYYFFDGYGRVYSGAYLMRKPYIPDGAFLAGDFSENLPIENLNKQNKKS